MHNVVLAPHIGGSTPDSLAAVASGAAATVLAYLDATEAGRPVPEELWGHCVNMAEMQARGDPKRSRSAATEAR